jgi:uncharacterized protein (DUF305 family)
MQRIADSIRYSLFALLALVGAVSAARAEMPAPDPAAANYEVRFMTKMIDHHAMAVMMAEMCVERAIHPDLTTMCTDIIANQQAEIEMQQMWLHHWYGITYEPDVNMASMTHLSTLYGAQFEITFMKTMIRHHSRAVREGARCVERAYHPDLIAMCTEMVAAQLQEIRTMPMAVRVVRHLPLPGRRHRLKLKDMRGATVTVAPRSG